jgi:hypothetical protein
MSKQMSSKDYLPVSWNEHARTLYLKALRDDVSINPTPLSQQHDAKKQKVTPSGLSLFRGALLKQSSTESSASAAADEEAVDTVLDELKRWEDKDLVIDLQEYSQYIAEDGLLNEFKMMWELRESFPLHFTVFKQTCRNTRSTMSAFSGSSWTRDSETITHVLPCPAAQQAAQWHTHGVM